MMTRAEYLVLKPGQCIRQKTGTRRYRVVIKPPCTKRGWDGRLDSGLTSIGLLKVQESWTSPRNKVAWHDAHVILRDYDWTPRIGMPQRVANDIYAETHWRPEKKEKRDQNGKR